MIPVALCYVRLTRRDGIRIPALLFHLLALLLGELVTLFCKEIRYQTRLNRELEQTSPSIIFMFSSLASSFSCASWAALNRLDRCWFIFARGATPSIAQARCQYACRKKSGSQYSPIAIMRTFLGLAMLTTLSVYLNTSTIISSSVSGAG